MGKCRKTQSKERKVTPKETSIFLSEERSENRN
jgi:hypothetical protein